MGLILGKKMTEKEALTKLYGTQKQKLARLESKLIKDPFRRLELQPEIEKQGGVIRGIGLSLDALNKLAQGDFDSLLKEEA